MSTSLTLDPESVKEIIRGAILQAIDEEAKEKLIAGAIDYLMTPIKGQGIYQQDQPAPLDRVFNEAVTRATREIIFESFNNDPRVKQAINDVVHPMLVKLCEGNYDGLTEKIGDAVGEWLQSRTKEY